MKCKSPKTCQRRRTDLGFSVVEILLVVVIALVLAAFAMPNIMRILRTYKSVGDARSLSDEVSLAKMRASATFTRARVYADRSAGQFRVETWTLPTGGTSNCWVAEGDTVCSQSYTGTAKP